MRDHQILPAVMLDGYIILEDKEVLYSKEEVEGHALLLDNEDYDYIREEAQQNDRCFLDAFSFFLLYVLLGLI